MERSDIMSGPVPLIFENDLQLPLEMAGKNLLVVNISMGRWQGSINNGTRDDCLIQDELFIHFYNFEH